MRELEDALIEEEGALHAAAAALAELDASLALASVATDFGFVRPEVRKTQARALPPCAFDFHAGEGDRCRHGFEESFACVSGFASGVSSFLVLR